MREVDFHLAFKYWIQNLTYNVKPMKKQGFSFRKGKHYGFITDGMDKSSLAKILWEEFEEHMEATGFKREEK